MDEFIHIDGSFGEGGGQVLRSSMSLAAITGKPLHIENIRAGRKKGGLLRQHLTSVQAAARVCNGRLEGDELGSTRLSFWPGPVTGGHFEFNVGSAGSTCLVAQTVLPILLHANVAATCRFEGGTHNPWSPPYSFLEQAFFPVLRKMGANIDSQLERYGFFPAGGGAWQLDLQPSDGLQILELTKQGKAVEKKAEAMISQIPGDVARRELEVLLSKLNWKSKDGKINQIPAEPLAHQPLCSVGPGNILTAMLRTEHSVEVAVGFGERGVRAERVAANTAKQIQRYMAANVAVGEYLADQLMLPMALAGGGAFTTVKLSKHSQTNAAIIERFLPVKVEVEVLGRDRNLVRIVQNE